MTTYYIKKYGVNELHQADCVWLPIRKGTVKFGRFDTADKAIEKARTLYDKVKPCPACCSISNKQRRSAAKK